MAVLTEDIAAFERMEDQLKTDHSGEWALFHSGLYVGVFRDFEAAASEALDRFDDGRYLIRQIGAPQTIQLPGGMIFTPAHALDTSRL